MRVQKIYALLLVLCLTVSLSVPALAAGTVLQVDQPAALPKVGETFTVTVSIEGNTGLSAAQMSLLYNNKAIRCTNVVTGDALEGMMAAANPEANNGAAVKVAAASADEVRVDGKMVTFTFEVLQSGSSDLKLDEVQLSNEKGINLPFTVQMGNQPQAPEEEPEENPEEETPDGPRPFTDVPSTHWAYENVNRAAEMGLIKGYADGTFGPERNMSRAEFVTVLWRMSGSPAPKAAAAFEDVKADDWFADQIAWASEQGYVNGADGKFSPNGVITREQVMSILFRYNGGKSGMETMFYETYDGAFTDSGSISPWAKPAVYWAVYETIVGGMTETTIVPQGNATRAQISTIFLWYLDSVEVETEEA